jgi:hypothetical protein
LQVSDENQRQEFCSAFEEILISVNNLDTFWRIIMEEKLLVIDNVLSCTQLIYVKHVNGRFDQLQLQATRGTFSVCNSQYKKKLCKAHLFSGQHVAFRAS